MYVCVQFKDSEDQWHLMDVRKKYRPKQQLHVATVTRVLQMVCRAAGCQDIGLVIDPFAGTASTGVAARALGCSFIGIDNDPTFVVPM